MKKIRRSKYADSDIEGIYNYIANHSVSIAKGQVDKINSQIVKIAEMPNIYKRIEASTKFFELRRSVVKPYIILFDNLPDVVEIVRVLHSRQDYKRIVENRDF
ncbi:MAG: type II toxin-antitoxin system RelE/ParE family toxin [Firmicutes bacterium]|nr:type II toxin-antitoxin system RelE/ParE family toxin [Bacillota bacterium]